MNIKRHIPNFITILNLVCGVFAILLFSLSFSNNANSSLIDNLIDGTTENNYLLNSYEIDFFHYKYTYVGWGCTLIFIALILDFLDGFVARLLKVQSEIGGQLDSLADMVTFGVAPGFLFFLIITDFYPESFWISILFVFIPIFSAIRLAKFNVDQEQTSYFKGLATPANAIFWVSMYNFTLGLQSDDFEYFKYILAFLIVGSSLLMTSNLRMFSLKLKNLKLEGDNIYRVILILGAIVLTIIFGLFTNIMAAIPFIIILYILLSISYHYKTRNINKNIN